MADNVRHMTADAGLAKRNSVPDALVSDGGAAQTNQDTDVNRIVGGFELTSTSRKSATNLDSDAMTLHTEQRIPRRGTTV